MKPTLIVVAESMRPNSGSEHGKGWVWSKALSRNYRLCVVTSPSCFEEAQAVMEREEWDARVTATVLQVQWGRRDSALQYRKWCVEALAVSRRLMTEEKAVGLHHLVLGSAKVLPAYETLGIPYTLGPLGGGEAVPWKWIFEGGFYLEQQVAEGIRHAANLLVPRLSGACRTVRRASAILAVTDQTERLLRGMGASCPVHRVFPDVFEPSLPAAEIMAAREGQAAALKEGELELLWYGRDQWWKGGQLALNLMSAARQAGIPCHMRMILDRDSQLSGALHRRIRNEKLEDRVILEDRMPRAGVLERVRQAHALVYPSMRDSSSSVIPECYAMGLPSITLGLAGVRVATGEGAGLNEPAEGRRQWLAGAVRLLEEWRRNPASWLAASAKAAGFSTRYGQRAIDACADACLTPDVYSWKAGGN